MKTKLFNFLLFFFVITVIPVFSQPVLTQNGILSQLGDSVNFKRGSNAPPITDIQGPDVTWNFTYDTTVFTSPYVVTKDPVQTPYFSSFPLASRCELTKPTSSVKWYSYQTVNAGLWEEVGHVSELLSNSNTSYNHYQDNETILQFPVHYGDSLMDYFSGYRINGSNDTNQQHGKRYYKADSYGTLIYSTGDTFTDVMRVLSVEHRIDSMPLSYDSTTINETIWYKEGIRTPLITRRVVIFWTYNYATQNVFSISFQYYFCLDPSSINRIDLTVMLEGPFNGTEMESSLQSIIPLNQPFNVSPWNYAGLENVSSIPNGNVVEWVLVDVRDAATASAATSASSIARKAAFILEDGSIVDLDGFSNLLFPVTISQNLYVVVWQRNHIGIMSNYALSEVGGIYNYNFTSGVNQVYGGLAGHKQLAIGVWGMFSGDGNKDGSVNISDYSPLWQDEAGTRGYLNSDYNLDGESDNVDKNNFLIPNIGMGSQVPD